MGRKGAGLGQTLIFVGKIVLGSGRRAKIDGRRVERMLERWGIWTVYIVCPHR